MRVNRGGRWMKVRRKPLRGKVDEGSKKTPFARKAVEG